MKKRKGPPKKEPPARRSPAAAALRLGEFRMRVVPDRKRRLERRRQKPEPEIPQNDEG